jgi:cytosine/adenosine deaminase-related metal-dependent hydrolase
MIWGRAVTLVNGRGIESIRFTSRIDAIGEAPRRGDTVVDLEGAFVLPGLINAHDHLELNHYGRLTFRDRYQNASEWIDDMRPRIAADPAIRALQRLPLTERLFVGGLKNVLAGVTTVAHHNPYYTELRRTMPVRVVRRYGWAHSFALERQPAGARGEPGGDILQRWRRTSGDAPFIVHLAEGTDAAAAAELPRLEALGCLASNTVIVHGVAIDADGMRRIAAAGAGLVWCPASNVLLFGRTAPIRLLFDACRRRLAAPAVALGSDSRLTGASDLLDELRVARDSGCASPDELLQMVTDNAAALLKLKHAGHLSVGAPADLTIVDGADTAAEALLASTRRSLPLVVVHGRPIVARRRFAPIFHARGTLARPICVDGEEKIADSGLARRIAGCPIAEPGVTVA